jgi:hypothetical protein
VAEHMVARNPVWQDEFSIADRALISLPGWRRFEQSADVLGRLRCWMCLTLKGSVEPCLECEYGDDGEAEKCSRVVCHQGH